MKKNILILLTISILTGCAVYSNTTTSPTITSSPINGEGIRSQFSSTLISPIDGMDMILIPTGKFQMGSKFGLTDEKPQHTVNLDSYWIDKTEVTNFMYNQCIEDRQCQQPNLLGSYEDQNTPLNYFNDPLLSNHPVAFVSWNNAKSYCEWADRRLPTEAEWEKAAIWNPILKKQQIYPWGNEFDCKMGNYDDEITLDASIMPDTTVGCDGFARSAPVGSFPSGASPYGVLDMGGNVWEWVHDAFIETDPFSGGLTYYSISPVNNPKGVDPSITKYRIMRGGSWNLIFGVGRGSYRLWFGLDDTYDGVGFRCAKSVD